MMTDLQNLLSGRIQRYQRYQGPSVTQLRDSVLKLVARSTDFSCLVESWVEWEQEEDSEALLEFVTNQKLLKPKFAQFTVSEVLETLIIQHVNKYIVGNELVKLENLARLVIRLDKEGTVSLSGISEDITTLVSDAQISWVLHKSGLARVDQQFRRHWKEKGASQLGAFLDSMVEVCTKTTDVGRGLTGGLVNAAFCPDRAPSQQMCQVVLKKLLMRLLDLIYEGRGDLNLMWINCQDEVEQSRQAKWSLFGLSLVLTYRPSVKVGEAVRDQHDWSVTDQAGLGAMVAGLLLASPSMQEVVQLVGRVMAREEVNWKAVLALVTVSTQLVPQADSLWHSMVERLVKEGLADTNPEGVLGGLLLARQAASATTPLFPSYQAWFYWAFGQEASSLCGPTRSHKFLLAQLTELVRWEPPQVLRSHLARPPSVPASCRQHLEDYKALAKSRLMEMQETPAEEMVRPSDEVFRLVLKCIEDFNTTKQIPKHLREAMMFKKEIFSSQLLPALLMAQPPTESLVTAREALVELLNQKGKITGQVYNRFKSGDFNQSSTPAEVKLPESDCTLVNMTELLAKLSDTDKEDTAVTLLGEIRYTLRCLVVPCKPLPSPLSLASILVPDPLASSLHNPLFTTLTTLLTTSNPSWVTSLVSLLTSSAPMLSQSIHHLLTTHTFHPAHLHLLTQLCVINCEVSLGPGKKTVAVLDILGSRYQTIRTYAQVETLGQWLSGLESSLLGVNLAKLEHIQDRVNFGKGGLLTSRPITEQSFRVVMELELMLGSEVVQQPLGEVQRTHFLRLLVQRARIAGLQVERMVLDAILEVWGHLGDMPSSSIIMIAATGGDMNTWLATWRQIVVDGDGVEGLRALQVLELVQLGPWKLESVLDLMLATKQETEFALPLSATRLILSNSSDLKTRLRPLESGAANLILASLAYWAAKGYLVLDILNTSGQQFHQFASWQEADLGSVDQVQVGLLLAAESWLDGGDGSVFESRVVDVAQHVGVVEVERGLRENPKSWFQGLMSSRVILAVSCVMSRVFCDLVPCSVKFLVHTLLPLHSEMFSRGGGDDGEMLGRATNRLVGRAQAVACQFREEFRSRRELLSPAIDNIFSSI